MGQVEQLRRVVKKRGWKAAFLDVDDTMISSNYLWEEGLKAFARGIAGVARVEEEEVLGRVAEENNRVYRVMGVHPSRFAKIAVAVAGIYGVEEEVAKIMMRERVRGIYLATPPLPSETEEVLGVMERVGLKVALVTHSPKGRIKRMMEHWKLDGKVPVFTESTIRPKGPGVWRRAVVGMEVSGGQAGVVDDKLESIMAAREAGIETCVWVTPRWDLYAEGKKPERVPQISGIGQLVRALVDNFG